MAARPSFGERGGSLPDSEGTPGLTAEPYQTKGQSRGRWGFPVVVCWLICSWVSSVGAGDLTEGFESDTKSWQMVRGVSRAKMLRHERTDEIVRTGLRSEALLLETFANDGFASLVHKLPPAMRFDELKASVWVWSNHPGIQVWVRVRLPHQRDERTGQMLIVDVKGDIHTGGGQWQRLAVDLSDRNFEETMRRVRSNLALQVGTRNANAAGAYVDQISLRVTEEQVTWELAIDDLELTPVVSPQNVGTAPNPDNPITTVERVAPRIRIGDDRVLLDGLPFFPMFVPYHGESTATLQKSLCNVVWVPDYEDRDLLQQMSEAGLGVMATPPQPDLETASPEQAGLLPFTAHTDPILFWMLDVQIPSSRLQQASAWAEMVRDADRQRARPIMADVMGKEREFHRQLSLVGTSRSILHTTKTPRMYADSLEQRMRMGLPGKPKFTLIPTSPAAELIASRPARSTVPVVEPEQIWMQANIALAAGFKGLGYLTLDSLETDRIGAEEQRLAIELMNYRIRLLESWLATAKVSQQARVQVGPQTTAHRSPLISSWDVRPGVVDTSSEGLAARQIQATVLECDQGLLILLNWIEDTSQYQPGWMVAQDVRILVNRDILQVCELTTTSLSEHTLDTKDVPGGTEIRLKDFNQSAVLLVPTDAQAKDALNDQLTQVRPIASQAWARLARAKLTRVREIHHQLGKASAPPVRGAEDALRDASHLVDQAEKLDKAGRHTEVEIPARRAMANLRSLQQNHWQNAVRQENSPASSPHTICFQTLPDHYRLKAALKRSGPDGENLLPSGGFDDSDRVLDEWTMTSELPTDSPIDKSAACEGPPGESCLHLGAAVPMGGRVPLPPLDLSPVLLTGPAIPVLSGQIVRVQGRIRIKQPLEASTDGLLIYDSLVGTAGALRFREATPRGDWQEFEFYREVAHSGHIRLMLELQGLGNVWLDDLRVTATTLSEPDIDLPQTAPVPRRSPVERKP